MINLFISYPFYTSLYFLLIIFSKFAAPFVANHFHRKRNFSIGFGVRICRDDGFSQKRFLIGIKNTGTSPIRRNDFDSLMKIDFGNKSIISSCNLIRSEPYFLTPKIEIDKSYISIDPILLNPGNELVFDVNCDCINPPVFQAHVANIINVFDISKSSVFDKIDPYEYLILSIFLLSFLNNRISDVGLINYQNTIIYCVSIFLLILFFCVPFFKEIVKKRRVKEIYSDVHYESPTNKIKRLPCILVGLLFMIFAFYAIYISYDYIYSGLKSNSIYDVFFTVLNLLALFLVAVSGFIIFNGRKNQ